MASQKHTHWWWIKKAAAEDGDAWLATLSEEDFDYLLKLKKQYDCMCFPMRRNVKKEMDRREEEAKNKKLSKIAASKAPRRTTGDKAVFNSKLADEKKVLPRNKRDEKASEDSGEDSDFLEVISSGVVSSSSSLSTPKRQCFTTPTQCPGAPSRGDQGVQQNLQAMFNRLLQEREQTSRALEVFQLAMLASSSPVAPAVSSSAATAAPVVAPANDDVNMYDDDDLIRSPPTAAAAPRSVADALVASIVEAAADPHSAQPETPGTNLFADEEMPAMSPFLPVLSPTFSSPRRRRSHSHDHEHRHRSVSHSPRSLFQPTSPTVAAAAPPVLTLASLVAAAEPEEEATPQ